MSRGWRLTAWASLALSVFLAGVAGGLTFVAGIDDAPPRDEIVGRTDKMAYRRGEVVSGYWDMLYLRACDDNALRWLTTSADRLRVEYLPGEAFRPVILPENEMPKRVRIDFVGFSVPPSWPLGRTQYHVRDEFACNWLQRLFPGVFSIRVDRPVVEFQVLPASAEGPL